jgi:hypothetical protein
MRISSTKDGSHPRDRGDRLLRRDRPHAQHQPVRGPAGHAQRLPHHPLRAGRHATGPRCPACSPPATSPTRSTARRSPRPASAAWPRSMPSASWKPASRHAAGSRRPGCATWGRQPPAPAMIENLRRHDSIDEIPAATWDGLHDGRNPFMRHAFLSGLESTGCLRRAWGWTPRHARCGRTGNWSPRHPAYLKGNSHGEFVFDHAWAHAYRSTATPTTPSGWCAVPYTPVTGPRLLARGRPTPARWPGDGRDGRTALGDGLSSAHVNFAPERDGACPGTGLAGPPGHPVPLARRQAGWRDFEDFLAALEPRSARTSARTGARCATPA